MKTAFVFVIVFVSLGFASVDQAEIVVENFIEAINDNNGYRAVCYISDEALISTEEIHYDFIATGTSAVVGLGLIGLEATPGELNRWDKVDFAANLLTCGALRVALDGAEVQGSQAFGENAASVDVLVMDYLTQSYKQVGLPMVLEGGHWKMANIEGILVSIPLQ